jgi:hypothetical protein
MNCVRVSLLLLLLAGSALALSARADEKQAGAGKPADARGAALFEKEVLPILKVHCFKCHGGPKPRGGLSLASRQGLLAGGDLGSAVAPEKPGDSLLLKAVNFRDGLEMPPSGKLPAREIEILTRWVNAGAPWPPSSQTVVSSPKGPRVTEADRRYWAFQQVRRPAPPRVEDRGWVRNPVDAFILAKLEARGLRPAPPADRTALARRPYYDLTGLPPTPEQVDAFVNDPAADAYERLVDRLLASPHYGEKWGRHWLDLVRYAETDGFEFDRPKPFAWRYRDYVITAFNADKPYDQFVREQLAGDLLPVVTQESMIATGYYRLGQWDSGAADRLQQKYDVLDSVLSTTGQVFLGLSVGCARCHDHKKDPIPQRDYYRLLAFFHNLTGMGGRGATKRVMAPADLPSYQGQLKAKQDRETELARRVYQLEQRFAVALAAKKGVKVSDLPAPDLTGLTYRFYRDTWDRLPDFDGLLPETQGPIAHNYVTLAPASRPEAIGLVFEGKLKVLQGGDYTFDLDSTDGARLLIDVRAVFDRPGKGRQRATAKVRLQAGLLPLRLEYFNTYDAPRLQLEWSGPGVARRPLTGDVKPGTVDLPALIGKHGAEVLGEGEAKRYAELVQALEASRKAKPAAPGIEVLCVSEGPASPTHLLVRGNPQAKGEQVEAGFPEVLSPPAAVRGLPQAATAAGGRKAAGRLALAEWLTDPNNPLTVRVMVNRLWQHHFGRGIVPTPNDFGKLGEAPTHPELLDWLAGEFVASGWRMKPLHRLLLTSSAYRMSSRAEPAALAADPANLLFWRFSMRRLTAEEVRDSILAVSGNLNRQHGGPGVYPRLPREVLATQDRPGRGWVPSPPEDAARRSVYVHVKRSLLLPQLTQFDLADTDQSCPARFTTTVPTQALLMLNDEFTNEQARRFARRLTGESPGGLEARVTRAIRLVTGRVPAADEVDRDANFVRSLRREHGPGEQEALRFYCLLLLNANEFIYLD